MSKKRNEEVRLRITYEMRQWLDELAASTGAGRSTVIASLLQAIMDDDSKAHEMLPASQGKGHGDGRNVAE